MTEPDVPSAYVSDKRTPSPSREELRARIPGWGADLDPADRPSHPKLQYAPDVTGAHWDFPERQPGGEGRERSIEHAFVTPVFGTVQPLHGASGAIRRLAYRRFSEGRLAHWMRSEEHTSELQSRQYLVCRLLLEKKKKQEDIINHCKDY